MALVSPGVEVQVVDESAYGAPGAGTVPLLLIATQQDKTDPTGSEADGIAKYTKSANAGEVVKVTSQRELTQYFGNPEFTTSGTSVVQGSETSEYGLMAAYSYLGQGSQAYIVRADLDLAQLNSSTTAPTAPYATDGGIWLDTSTSAFGIHQWNNTTSKWEVQTPLIEINDTDDGTDIEGGVHVPTTGVVNGSFLVIVNIDNETSTSPARQASIEYLYGVGGVWEAMDQSTGMSSGEAVTYAAHYSAPLAPSNDDIWVKTTRLGNGIDLKFFQYLSSVGAFVSKTVQGVSTTQADGAGVIGDFVPQDGSSANALTSGTATDGALLIDQENGNTMIIREVDGTGNVTGITATSELMAMPSVPTDTIATGTYWFDNTINSLDLYRQVGGAWVAATDVVYSTTQPTTDAAGNALAVGDIWVDTTLAASGQANERDYPKIKVYNGSAWVTHDNTDQTTTTGVIFADFFDTAGGGSPITGAPSPTVYPAGMVAVNMAQSKNTVRTWNGTAWRNGASNHADGSGRFGRYAQRGVIATAMQAVAAGTDLRDPGNRFSLIAAPNYPELVDEMVTLNSDRGETAFIIVDTPMRKNPTDVISWVQNSNTASENGEDGLVTNNTYSAVYYPSGATTEPLNGNTVIVPPSHMALYTYAYNDNISFQWFAPAGTTRGVVQNASSVGYITTENEFKAIALSQGQRDAMYTVKLNPITTFVGQGTIVFGQKTLHTTTSALDRVNVARLVAYLRDRFDELARPFLFEINDAQTRARAKIAFERFLADILSRRGLNDFAVVCDESNNTPARIDRNEFYVDVAIEPAKAAEFIYVPIRLVNTGALSTTN